MQRIGDEVDLQPHNHNDTVDEGGFEDCRTGTLTSSMNECLSILRFEEAESNTVNPRKLPKPPYGQTLGAFRYLSYSYGSRCGAVRGEGSQDVCFVSRTIGSCRADVDRAVVGDVRLSPESDILDLDAI